MADPPTGTEHYTPTPLWVKVFGIIALVVALVFVIVLVTRGPHRPGMHTNGGGSALSSSITAPGAGGGDNPSDRGY